MLLTNIGRYLTQQLIYNMFTLSPQKYPRYSQVSLLAYSEQNSSFNMKISF